MTSKLLLTLAASAAALSVLPAAAQQETARVISSTPVMTQVAVPRQVCSSQQVTTPGQKSGAGGILGAIAGGALGSNVGGGDGRIAATMIGVIGGAMLGDKIEGAGTPKTENVQSCTTQTFYETRTSAYNVVYEYAGKQYTVQMPNDPGPFLRLQITPVPAAVAPSAAPVVVHPAPTSAPTVPAVPAAPATPAVTSDAGAVIINTSPLPGPVIASQPVTVVSAYPVYPQVVYGAPVVVAAPVVVPVARHRPTVGWGMQVGTPYGHVHPSRSRGYISYQGFW
jgi:uncharacterized protein YcfJ